MQKQTNILLVEDNPSDVWALRLAIEEAGLSTDLNVLSDGEQAMSFIAEAGSQAAPDLLILDLNLPHYSGHELMDRWRASPLKSVPILVVTSSDSSWDRDRAEVFTKHYFRKPIDLDEFLLLGGVIKDVLNQSSKQAAV